MGSKLGIKWGPMGVVGSSVSTDDGEMRANAEIMRGVRNALAVRAGGCWVRSSEGKMVGPWLRCSCPQAITGARCGLPP
eukprot:1160019-Pelagomonas_calceolata.AAC.2